MIQIDEKHWLHIRPGRPRLPERAEVWKVDGNSPEDGDSSIVLSLVNLDDFGWCEDWSDRENAEEFLSVALISRLSPQ